MNLDYRTTRRPAGEPLTDSDPPLYEVKGYTAASFSGKCVVTGGHMRPLILEQIGNDVETHPMGIKPPLIAPSVTIGEGSYSGAVQVAFQRINSISGQRSDISPIWPGSGSQDVAPSNKSWTEVSSNPTIPIGRIPNSSPAAYTLGVLQQIKVQANTSTSVPFGGADVDSSGSATGTYFGTGVVIYGYVPEGEVAVLGVDAGVDLEIAVYKGSNTALGEQVTEWFLVRKETIPREGEQPTIQASFASSFEFDESSVYRIVVRSTAATPASYVALFYTQDTASLPTGPKTTATLPLPTTIATWADVSGGTVLGRETTDVLGSFQRSYLTGSSRDTAYFTGTFGSLLNSTTPISDFLVDSAGVVNAVVRNTFFNSTVTEQDMIDEDTRRFGAGVYSANSYLVPDLGNAGHIYAFLEQIDGATRFPVCLRSLDNGDTWAAFAVTNLNAATLGMTTDDQANNKIVDVRPILGGGAYIAIKGGAGARRLIKINSSFAIVSQNAAAEMENCRQIAVDTNDSDTVYMATPTGIYKTTNAGSSWTLVEAGNFYSIDTHDAGADCVIYAGGSGLIAKSSDNGSTWGDLTSGVPAGVVNQVRISPISNSIVYAATPSFIIRSKDAGATFDAYMPFAALVIRVDPADATVCFATRYLSAGIVAFDDAGFDRRNYFTLAPVNFSEEQTITDPALFHETIGFLQVASGAEVYGQVTDGSITIDLSTATSREPEAISQGGTENYDKIAVLLRDRALGIEFRQVAVIDLGESFTFNENALALGVKQAIVPGFYEVAGGFESVENYRVFGTERLVFISQPGYDSLRGIPGSGDYEQRFLSPRVYRAWDRMFLTGERIGSVLSVNTGTRTITLRAVNGAAFTQVAVGQELPFVDNANGNGGHVIVESATLAAGVYTIVYYDYAYLEPSGGCIFYLPTGEALPLGTLGANARDLGSGEFVLQMADGFVSEFGAIPVGSRVAFTGTANGYLEVLSIDASNGEIVFSIPNSVSAPEDGDAILFPHSALHFADFVKGVVFLTETDQEIGRAWPKTDAASGLIELYTDWARTALGTNGSDPAGAYALEARFALLGTVQKGSSRIRTGLPVANDFWHQRDVSFLGDTVRQRIKKIVKYDTNTGERLLSPEIELFEPWRGDDHSLQPMEVISDYSSLHIAGAAFGRDLSNAESISDFTKLNLVPKTGTIVVAAVSGRLFVFAEKDEIFEISVDPFIVPTSGAAAEEFAIEDLVDQVRQSASFAISTTRKAIDERGRIYLAGPQGIFSYVSPNVYQIRGMRDRFAKFFWKMAPKFSMALDPSLFPEAALRIANVGYLEGETNEQLAYSPMREQWMNFGGGLNADEIAGAQGQDNSALVLGGARGKVYVYGQVIADPDHTEWNGEDYGRNYLINGQVSGESFGGYITGGDVNVENVADPLIYAVDATYRDSTVSPPELLDLSGFGIVLNTPTEGPDDAREPVESAILGVPFVKWNDATGAQERGVVVGLKIEEDGTNTIYVKAESAWTDLSVGQRYYWAIGPRPWQITTREIEPTAPWRGVAMVGFEMVVDSAVEEEHPWWIRVQAFFNFTGKGIDWTQPVVDRIYSWREFTNESRLMRPFYTVPAVGFVVRVSGHAPTNRNFRITEMRVIKDNCLV